MQVCPSEAIHRDIAMEAVEKGILILWSVETMLTRLSGPRLGRPPWTKYLRKVRSDMPVCWHIVVLICYSFTGF